MVQRTRGGTLTRGVVTHPIHPSHRDDPQAEIRIVWGLTDIISPEPFLRGTEVWKTELAELEKKAAEKRKSAIARTPGTLIRVE
jgi:hypothetical protein